MSVLLALGVDVTNLVTDSRAIRPGDTFVAYPGERVDGRQFIAQAIAAGANAVLWDTQDFVWNPAWPVPNLGVEHLRRQAGWLADQVYGTPSERLWTIGVTGTNGKTSTTHWIASVLSQLERPCALIGTLGNGFQTALQVSANTTPDAICIHRALADYERQGAQAVAMEVSSHALNQDRTSGVRFDVAMLTNLSRDHLDYHGSMEHYAASKRKLFELEGLKCAVLNFDDTYGRSLAGQVRLAGGEVVAYGLTSTAHAFATQTGISMVYGRHVQMDGYGLQIDIASPWGEAVLQSGLVGRFNAENLLAVLATLLMSGVGFAEAVQHLALVQPVAGRLQRLHRPGGPTVLVDYAHTPDALEKVLLTLRESCQGGRLHCVFGCGGDRDRGKRPLMGHVAERYADVVILTNDNPRSEAPEAILAEIESGMTQTQHRVIADRAAAIRAAIEGAVVGDCVLIAGKGHETYQEINGVRHPFSDVRVVEEVLQTT